MERSCEITNLSLLSCRAATDVDNIRLQRFDVVAIEKHLEPMLDFLCQTVRYLNLCLERQQFVLENNIENYKLSRSILKALGYDLRRPKHGDTIDNTFPKLIARLTSILCTLQAICHDPKDEFDPMDIYLLALFLCELSECSLVELFHFADSIRRPKQM